MKGKNNIRNRLIGMLAVGALSCGGVNAGDLESKVDDFTLNVNVTNTIASDFSTKSGFFVGKGPVNQTYIDMGIGNNLSVASWMSYDFNDNDLHEFDLYLTAHAPLFSINEGLLKGNISGKASLQGWFYPSGLLGEKPDFAFETGVHHSGFLETDLTLTHVLTDSFTLNRNRLYLEISKPIRLGKLGEYDFSVIPSVGTPFHDNFYGENGFGHVTSGIDLRFSKGNYSLDLFAKHQFGISDTMDDRTYFGVSFSINDISRAFKDFGKILAGK